MARRELLLLVGGAVTASRARHAQQRAMPVIGFLATIAPMRPGEGPLSTVPVVRKSSDKLRVNPRKSWYANLDRVTTNGDYEVAFHLKRAQPGFLTFLAFSLAGSLGRVASRRSPAVSGIASIEP